MSMRTRGSGSELRKWPAESNTSLEEFRRVSVRADCLVCADWAYWSTGRGCLTFWANAGDAIAVMRAAVARSFFIGYLHRGLTPTKMPQGTLPIHGGSMNHCSPCST